MKGGILVKDGKQTSCEIAVLDSRSSMVSASCLAYKNGKVDTSIKHEVYLDNGLDGKTAKYTVEMVSVNQNYNATSLANSLAVLQYNSDGKLEWNNTVGIGRGLYWDDVVFVRRTISDLDNMEWTTPIIQSNISEGKNCDDMSVLYDKNNSDFECNDKLVDAQLSSLTICQVPYGSVYAVIDSKLYLAGIYSYTATYQGHGNLCYSGSKSNYYLLLRNYLSYASSVLGRFPDFFPLTNATLPTKNAYYSMTKPTDEQSSNYFLTKGDYYLYQGDDLNQSFPGQSEEGYEMDSSLSGSSDAVDDSIDDSSDYSSDESNNGADHTSGLSKKNTVIIGVCSSIGGVLLACLFFLMYRLWKHRKIDKVDPLRQAAIQRMLETDIGGTTVPPPQQSGTHQPNGRNANLTIAAMLDYDLPPIYDDPQTNDSRAGEGEGQGSLGNSRSSLHKKT
ncbi:hypothetical protein H4217_006072 [Coemansia sp. RSA 1939]|nr:hypothetical protein H4217_006072 [Coemansia sp. RSA 1939]KAJ2607020.1 hypothetical protein EV177_005772 [Coemansia sp. RSA 1804]